MALGYLHENSFAFRFALTPQSRLGEVARLTTLNALVSTIRLKQKKDKQTGEVVQTRFKNILKIAFMHVVQ